MGRSTPTRAVTPAKALRPRIRPVPSVESRPSLRLLGSGLAAGSGNAPVLSTTSRRIWSECDKPQPKPMPPPQSCTASVTGPVDAQVAQQRRHVVDARLQRVGVARAGAGRIVRLVRQAHADMVGHDAAVAIAQAQHQLAPVITPRRVAVQHQHDLAFARTLVQVAHGHARAHLETVRSEGIVREGVGLGHRRLVGHAAGPAAQRPPLSAVKGRWRIPEVQFRTWFDRYRPQRHRASVNAARSTITTSHRHPVPLPRRRKDRCAHLQRGIRRK